MKMNKFLRLASALMILTLISTCAIGGTFAKYVTSDSAADKARVAKWGVEVYAWDDALFATSYETGNVTVVSSTSDLLVAPGTKNDTGVNFKITGKPEVKVNVKFEMTINKDVVIPSGEYLDWTTGADTTDKYTLSAAYTPVVFTLKQGATQVASGTLTDIKNYLEGSSVSKDYDANTDLTTTFGEFTLTWAWAFDTNDQADTTLGNKAAGLTDATATNVETNIDYSIKITVTQVN